ncbi:acetyl-CoA carboxylase biotin carboxyl carrier protein subunit [Lactobacillus sp. S2-2]|uniref:acetyl-CoA carboxylase biotin carboxyl carrier protein n=1 Tax=Lactobacillus sp. S2-2 TaxID=2692917 RepID=UPI001F3ED2FD|nr:biotin/lipoyl-containing protein [Lactobacillus sp. S2-2]MCF6514661.1 acetyl-CoA carboxylase biotin carboxyl carrier protein subunit [Lactobacillus sp. S2-2]
MNGKDIEHLMDKFDQSSLKELKIDGNDVNVYFSKLDQKVENTTLKNNSNVENNVQSEDVSNQSSQSNDNYKLKAPMVGLVYFSPSPEKPVFKEEGDHIKKGEVICVIEAMKVINEIKSTVSGTLVKKLVNNGDMIEYDEPLFEIEED